MKRQFLTPQFVEFIPENVEEGSLYISEIYKTAIHKCCCGCGEEVVTPLTPADWQLTLDGTLVSLFPSIGNWSYPCKSHYWIVRNKVEWAARMSPKEIQFVQERDRRDKQQYVAQLNEQRLRAMPWWQKLWISIKSLLAP